MTPPEDTDAYAGWNLDPEGGWSESRPDEKFFGILREVVIRDATFDRYPRPIRQFSARIELLDRRGQFEDGEVIPLNKYTNASLEVLRKDENAPGGQVLRPAPKGNNKAAHILTNWAKAGIPLKDFQVPPPVDAQGQFVPLPEEKWTSPKDGEEKSANQVHIASAEGVKVEVLYRYNMAFPGGKGGAKYEAHNVAEIVRVLPPDFEVPEADVVLVPLKRDSEAAGEGAPGSESGGGSPAPGSVSSQDADSAAIQALVGKKSGEALNALMELPEQFRIEPWVSGLSGEGAPLVQQYVEQGRLVVDAEGKLALPAAQDEAPPATE